MQSLQDRNNEEKLPTEAGRNKEVGDCAERKDNSSQETRKSGNQARTTTKRKVDHLEGEFKKIKPTNLDGESRTGEEVEAWLLDIKKYFQIYNYSRDMKVRMAVHNLKGKEIIWWKDLKISH